MLRIQGGILDETTLKAPSLARSKLSDPRQIWLGWFSRLILREKCAIKPYPRPLERCPLCAFFGWQARPVDRTNF
jgi:hypothetical protein